MPLLAHFWVHSVYIPAWVSYSVRSNKEVSDGLSSRTGRCRYPVFRYVGISEVRNSLAWVFVRAK
jgi:hypothetical protein